MNMNFNKNYLSSQSKRMEYVSLFRWTLLIAIGVLVLSPVLSHAQDDVFSANTMASTLPATITGRVTSASGTPLENVQIQIKGSETIGLTDREGFYTLDLDRGATLLVFEKENYVSREVVPAEKMPLNVVLDPIEVVHLLWDEQSRNRLTASVSVISGDELRNLPGSNRNNVLGGRATGLTVQQSNGLPGEENSALYVRGLNSLSSNTALLLVDGYPRENASYLNPQDIESVTVLKDAAATTIYGMRGGAGVVLVNTKRGVEGPLTISVNSSYGFQEPTAMPNYLNAYDYAYLYNEASRNDGGSDIYSPTDLENYRTGNNPYDYPDVNWINRYLKDATSSQRYSLSARGGTDRIRYYTSMAYDRNSGIYHTDQDANTYNTNHQFGNYYLRTNVDVQVSTNLMAKLDVGVQQKEFNFPGNSALTAGTIISTLYGLPPNAHPVFNADSSLAGTSQYTSNPYGLLNASGYSRRTTRASDVIFTLRQGLDQLTQGLTAWGSVSFDSYFSHDIRRHKGFYVYEGSLANERGENSPAEQVNQSSFSGNQRTFDLQLGLDYQRSFGLNEVDGRLFVNEYTFSPEGAQLPRVYRGLMGRVNYVYGDRYIANFSFAYQGNEQLGDNNRFIFYPAVALGWVVSEEPFFGDNSTVSFLKLRASHGLSGNDRDIAYFQKQSFFEVIGSSYQFGTNLNSYRGFREGLIGSPNIRPSQTRKSNLGIDAELFGNIVRISGDLFYEKTTDIITSLNRISGLLGAPSTITGNAGSVENKGFELALRLGNQIGRDFQYSVQGTFSYAKNKILDMQERLYPHEYNYRTGHPVGSRFGLEAVGFFYDEVDIANSADQSAYSSVRPGDLKYRDINGDGQINEDDFTRIGKSWIPEVLLGTTLNLAYKSFDFSALLEGVMGTDRFMSNFAYYDFFPGGTGNLMQHHLNRWAYNPELGVDTRDTATYPRLSLQGENSNNKQPNSDFWLRDASYLRIKSMELGYSLPSTLLETISLKQVRIYATVYNAFTFTDIEVVDPEAGNGAVFPIQRMMNFGINLQF